MRQFLESHTQVADRSRLFGDDVSCMLGPIVIVCVPCLVSVQPVGVDVFVDGVLGVFVQDCLSWWALRTAECDCAQRAWPSLFLRLCPPVPQVAAQHCPNFMSMRGVSLGDQYSEAFV